MGSMAGCRSLRRLVLILLGVVALAAAWDGKDYIHSEVLRNGNVGLSNGDHVDGEEPPVKAKGHGADRYGGDLCGVVALFNPAGFRSRLENFRAFRKASKAQGLWLLVMELVLEGDPGRDANVAGHSAETCSADTSLEAGIDAEIVITVRGSLTANALWQKERLLSAALEHLPAWCDKVVWPDAELIFSEQNWVELTSRALDVFGAVQPFRDVVRLVKGQSALTGLEALSSGQVKESMKKETGWTRCPGIAAVVTEAREQQSPPLQQLTQQQNCDHHVQERKQRSAVRDQRAVRRALSKQQTHGYTGFAWAARRNVLERAGGLFDRAVIGGGDALIAHAFVGNFFGAVLHDGDDQDGHYSRVPYFYKDRLGNVQGPESDTYHGWAQKAWAAVTSTAVNTKTAGALSKLGQGVGFVRGTALHLWHGDKANRQYLSRFELLRDLGFDASKHLELRAAPASLATAEQPPRELDTSVLLWAWTADASPLMRKAVLAFFANRKED